MSTTTTTTTTPHPFTLPIPALVEYLARHFPDLSLTMEALQLQEAELKQLVHSAELSDYLETSLKLATVHFQLQAAKFAHLALEGLASILHCGSPETARRSANTILQLAGKLPFPKNATPKQPPFPTPEIDITKQHPPIYNDSRAADTGILPAQKTIPTSSNPQPSIPPTASNPLSDFSIQNPASKPIITNTVPL